MKEFITVKQGSKTLMKELHEINYKGQSVEVLEQNLKKVYEHINDLVLTLEKGTFVQSDKKYIVEIDGELKQVESLKVFGYEELEKDIKWYKVENNKIVLDKNKIGGTL